MIRPEQLIRPPQADSTLEHPLEHLVACHDRIEERLATLERVGDHFENRRQQALDALDACIRFLDSSGVLHTVDEEESVFPRLRPFLSAHERAYVEGLESQHREADHLYGELKGVAADLRAGRTDAETLLRYRQVAGSLCRLYRSHIASENEVLIALGRRELGDAELAAISQEMRQRRGLPAIGPESSSAAS